MTSLRHFALHCDHRFINEFIYEAYWGTNVARVEVERSFYSILHWLRVTMEIDFYVFIKLFVASLMILTFSGEKGRPHNTACKGTSFYSSFGG